MSGVLKSIGKVFRKVVHSTIGKIVVGALMIGAVVLTAGAALGALPAIGSVLGSVGISGTMASVLGGAISMGAVGAVTGGVMAGIQGKNVWGGATTGFGFGAAAGAAGGALGLISPNGVLADMGVGNSAANIRGLQATNTLSKFMSPSQLAARGLDASGNSLPGAASPAAAPGSSAPIGVSTAPAPTTATVAPASAAAPVPVAPSAAAAPTSGVASAVQPLPSITAPASGGLLHTAGSIASTPSLLQLGGSMLAGFAQGSASSAATQAQILAQQQNDDRTAMNYGVRNIYGTDAKGRTINGVPIRQDMTYNYGAENLSQPNGGLLASAYRQGVSVPYFQIVGGQVMQVG